MLREETQIPEKAPCPNHHPAGHGNDAIPTAIIRHTYTYSLPATYPVQEIKGSKARLAWVQVSFAAEGGRLDSVETVAFRLRRDGQFHYPPQQIKSMHLPEPHGAGIPEYVERFVVDARMLQGEL